MNALIKGLILGSALAVGAGSANAGVINFNTCWTTSCEGIGVSEGDVLPQTLATLAYENNGAGGVDFVLTNTIGNLYPGDDAFIGGVGFNFSGILAESDIVLPSDTSIQKLETNHSNSHLTLDIRLKFKGSSRIRNNEVTTWTFNNFDVTSVELSAFVHFQSVAAANNDSLKIVGIFPDDLPEPVPEPGVLLLFGASLLGLGIARKLKV